MSNDVKDRGLTGAILDALWPILGGSHTAASVWTEIDNAVSDVIARHQPQEREAVLDEVLSQHGLVLTDDPDFDHDEQTFEKAKASFVAALTTPAPAVSRDDQALFNDICDNMAEVLKPLPGEE